MCEIIGPYRIKNGYEDGLDIKVCPLAFNKVCPLAFKLPNSKWLHVCCEEEVQKRLIEQESERTKSN